MKNILDNTPEILLMGPGPSLVSDTVLNAMAKKTVGHLDPYFLSLMDETKVMLQQLLGTSNQYTIPISGTGSAGMETCFVNLVEKGDRVLILCNGVFGMRMIDVAGRLGAEVDKLEFPFGESVQVEAVRQKLQGQQYKIVAVVHAETSTGVLNPVAEIGALLKGSDTLYLVDTVTSLGGIEVRMDDWGIDALYSGTQKCLSCPPGLSPVSFSDRAMQAVQKRASKVPNWYLDLTMIANYWGQSRVYHHTAPINMLYGFYQALFNFFEEGADKVFARHQAAHQQLVTGLAELGLKMLVEEKSRLPMLNAVIAPEGVDEAAVRKRLRAEFQIEIGGGLGALAGKIWRIGLMGHTARPEHVNRFLLALSQAIKTA
jgi:alanine-glyoxylate transaminase / serine-glyoxylate transaminase / serine-pyruvate transaminase